MPDVLPFPLACGSCSHWKRRPPDPANLAAPPQGECHWGPPAVSLIPQPQGMVPVVFRPPLPADFPACGQHRAAGPVLDLHGVRV